jgi:polyisoprenoid-binding protein YceI
MSIMSTSSITWNIDPSHSRAEFKVKHMMISNVKGSFSGITGTLIEDPANPSLDHIDASIAVNTVNTGDEKRDEHLKNADFFIMNNTLA